ncbi:epimerase [Sedimentitalea sp. CY04]|uniref:Epimerase n=1 Tax=Parasedimentitalea denitrificans TaxID=2211118 RepID=A0ABX0W3Z9_9RHOB|nr:sugar nucleotide-binding protein [Sedimentitalea sp. CY04]NIZ60284.1 epimerase [Sedimentitalea sp. CY04]
MTGTVLILGATGRIGRACSEAFSQAGWEVRHFDRKSGQLMQAARGAQVIVNGWNPNYPDWAEQVPELHAQVIASARAVGATVIVPGNVYVFGQHTPGPWSESTPHHAENPLGKIRVEMEKAYRQSGVRTILLRAGDFLDTQASGNWFDMILIKDLAKGRFTYPGDPDLPHAWGYLPDLARAAVALAEKRAALPVFTDVPFAGYTLTGRELLAAVNRVSSQQARLKSMSWLPLQLARPFWAMARGLLEMRYLWNTGHRLDGARFEALLPGFRHTPLDQAIASALPSALVQRDVQPDQTVATGEKVGLV